MIVPIIDETGEITSAELETYGRVTVANVDGRLLLPGAYTVLSEEGATAARRAENRAKFAGFSDLTRI